MFLSSSFDFTILTPVVILIAISALIPIILSVLKIKFIPFSVVEIVAGIIIGSFFNKNGMFTNEFSEGLYIFGMAFLLFLSGLDTDFSVFKKHDPKDHHVDILKVSVILIIAVLLISLLASFIFINYIEKDKLSGILLLTIAFSTTFASIVVPILHQRGLGHTAIGKVLCTYAEISELLSIVLLSIFMVFNRINHDQKPWLLLFVILTLVITYVIERFVKKDNFQKVMDGFTHLALRLCLLVFIICMIISQVAGVEFILGAFLAGVVLRVAKLSHHSMEKLEVVGYGIFVPIFYILLGVKIPFMTLIKNPEYIGLTLALFGVLILVKLPFMYLLKWFKVKAVIPSMLITTCTIIVAITLESFHIFKEEFSYCLILASTLTCIIPPSIFRAIKKENFHEEREIQTVLE